MYGKTSSKKQAKSRSKARRQPQPLNVVKIPGIVDVRNSRKAGIRTASLLPAILTGGQQLVVNETVVSALTSDEEKSKDDKSFKGTTRLGVTDVKVSFRCKWLSTSKRCQLVLF